MSQSAAANCDMSTLSIAKRRRAQARFWDTYQRYRGEESTHKCQCGCGIEISNKSKAVFASAACRKRYERHRAASETALPGLAPDAPRPPRHARKAPAAIEEPAAPSEAPSGKPKKDRKQAKKKARPLHRRTKRPRGPRS